MNFKSLLAFVILFQVCLSFSQVNNEHLSKNKPLPAKMLLENKGQWPEGVLFRSNMNGGKVWIQQHKLIYHLQDAI